jgi:hypothetical protein
MADNLSARVVPFVLDIYGRLGEEAREFVERIALFAESQHACPELNLRSKILNEVSVALQKGNALMLNRMISHHVGSVNDNQILSRLSSAAEEHNGAARMDLSG